MVEGSLNPSRPKKHDSGDLPMDGVINTTSIPNLPGLGGGSMRKDPKKQLEDLKKLNLNKRRDSLTKLVQNQNSQNITNNLNVPEPDDVGQIFQNPSLMLF